MTHDLASRVRARANDRCEYCQRPQSASRVRFHIEHVVAQQHGGRTTMGNLALACPECNLRKGTNVGSYIRMKNTMCLVPLYNPRRHRWDKHFRWDGPELVGLTPIGRATVHVLALNAPRVVGIRMGLIAEGSFPPRAGGAQGGRG
jgi:hypothetical protein